MQGQSPGLEKVEDQQKRYIPDQERNNMRSKTHADERPDVQIQCPVKQQESRNAGEHGNSKLQEAAVESGSKKSQ